MRYSHKLFSFALGLGVLLGAFLLLIGVPRRDEAIICALLGIVLAAILVLQSRLLFLGTITAIGWDRPVHVRTRQQIEAGKYVHLMSSARAERSARFGALLSIVAIAWFGEHLVFDLIVFGLTFTIAILLGLGLLARYLERRWAKRPWARMLAAKRQESPAINN